MNKQHCNHLPLLQPTVSTCNFFFTLVQMRMGACIGMTLLFNQIMTRTNIILLFEVRENALTSTGCVHSNI